MRICNTNVLLECESFGVVDQVTPDRVDDEKCCALRPLVVGGTQDHNLFQNLKPAGAAK